MPGRSQRHLREFYGVDSAGDTYYPGPGGGTQRVVTIVPDTLNIDQITPGVSVVTVTDNGAPVQGAVVTVQTSNPAVATATGGTTTAAGTADVTVTGTGGGAAVITVLVDGKIEGTITTNVAVLRVVTVTPDTLNIDTTTPGTSVINVTDDGAPAQGVAITTVSDDPAVATSDDGATDAQGDFTCTVTGVAAGNCSIAVSADGDASGTITVTVA